jgi:hypothetical protein
MTSENGKQELFAGLPRTRRLGGAVTIALVLVLGGAFVTDAVPTRSSEDWIYDMEARRDQLARAHQARQARDEAAQPERRAARTPAAAPSRRMAYAAVAAPLAGDAPGSSAKTHVRCTRAFE